MVITDKKNAHEGKRTSGVYFRPYDSSGLWDDEPYFTHRCLCRDIHCLIKVLLELFDRPVPVRFCPLSGIRMHALDVCGQLGQSAVDSR